MKRREERKEALIVESPKAASAWSNFGRMLVLSQQGTPLFASALYGLVARCASRGHILLIWSRFFGPLSGHAAKLEDAVARYVALTFCYGCNLGPSQTARSLTGVERRDLSWVNQHHITEERLDEAIRCVTEVYNRFHLPKYWGTGKRASADGTKWEMYEQNLLAEYHIRYAHELRNEVALGVKRTAPNDPQGVYAGR